MVDRATAVIYRGRIYLPGDDLPAEVAAALQRRTVAAPPMTAPDPGTSLTANLGISAKAAAALMAHSITTVTAIAEMTDEELLAIPGIGPGTLRRIREALR